MKTYNSLYEEIISLSITNWIENKEKFDTIITLIDDFESLALEKQLYSSIAKLNIIRAMVFKHTFDFPNATTCLKKTISLSTTYGLPYHKKLAKEELHSINKKMLKFNEIYEKNNSPAPDQNILDKNEILSYIQNLGLILSSSYE